jgi:hypothetical protein
MDRAHFDIGDRPTDGAARPSSVSFFAALMVFGLVAGTAFGQDYPLPPPAGPLPQLSPPALVRIVGVTTKSGARIRRLTVRAPIGAAVVSRCVSKTKKRCPYAQRIIPVTGGVGSRTIHIKGFERTFRAGVVLQLYVVKAGRTGKFTSFKIRLRKTPLRRDRCVSGITLTPVGCPSG